MALVFVHGGVSAHPSDSLPSLAASLSGSDAIASALDAIEASVTVLENDPLLNAGFGSVLTSEGKIEMDAGIVEGSSGRFGGVATVTAANPIKLARAVMEETPHVFLSGVGAMAICPDAPVLTETTDAQTKRYQEASSEGLLEPEFFASPETADTVGAVALAEDGTLAAGSSSGGVFGKLPGRVGDACIFGAGVYASKTVAVVGTGIGEIFIETLAAARAGALVEAGRHPLDACRETIALIDRRRPVEAGLLALDSQGRVAAVYRGGSWAVEGLEGSINKVCIGPA